MTRLYIGCICCALMLVLGTDAADTDEPTLPKQVAALQDLIQILKSKSQPPLYGSNGMGSSSHMTSELFSQRTGIKIQHVPYKAASEALVGTANGDLDLLFMNMPPSLPMIQSGKVRPLAVTSSYRARQLPDVPTMQEQGMQDFDVTSWLGYYGPAGMPQDIVDIAGDIMGAPEDIDHVDLAGYIDQLPINFFTENHPGVRIVDRHRHDFETSPLQIHRHVN